MSRGRECNTVHVVADSLDQAAEDLTRDWSVDHRARWAIDSGTPATEPLAVEHDDRAPAGMRAALHHARLQAERDAIAAAIPQDPSPELAKVEQQLAGLRRDRTHLLTGQGRYAANARRSGRPAVHRGPGQALRRTAPCRGVRQLAGPPPLAQGGHPMGRRRVRR